MKKIFTLFLVLAVFCFAGMSVSAETEPDYIVDDAGILSYSEEKRLEDKVIEIKEEFGCDVGIYTVDFGSTSISDYEAQYCAEEHYNESGFSDDGILLMIFLDDNGRGGTHIATAGECIKIFDDELLYDIEDNFYDYLVEHDYYNAALSFISDCEYEIDDYYSFDSIWFLIAPIIGVVIAFIVVSTMKSELNSVRSKPHASDYTKPGSMNLTSSSDIFLYRRVTRTPRPQNTSKGGSSHSGAGGRSFGGHSGRRF